MTQFNTGVCEQAGARQKLVCSILESEEVQFQWCIINVELDDSLASSLLQRTVYDSPWVWPCICMLGSRKQKRLLKRRNHLGPNCIPSDPFTIQTQYCIDIKALKCKTLGAELTHAYTLCNNISAFYADDYLPTYI